MIVQKNKFSVRSQDKVKEFELSDLFTEEFYRTCDVHLERYCSDLIVVNEIYLNIIQPVQAIVIFLKKENIKYIWFQKPEENLFSMVMDAAGICKIKTIGIPRFYRSKRKIVGYINTFLAAGYLFWKQLMYLHSDTIETDNSNFSVIRTPAAKKKLSFIEGLTVKYENFVDNKTIYHCFWRSKRLRWVLQSWFYSYHELMKIKFCIEKMVGKYSASESFYYYSKRMAHTLLYQFMLKQYFNNNKGKTFYTGNNLDRFSIIEERLARKYKIKIICIPHGLEYGFKLPHCFVGDIFYATSEKAAAHLNNIYHTNKFVYDSKITQKMFSVNHNVTDKKKVIFFTEPREVFVNIKIIDQLLPLLEKENISLALKLHPKDQISDYIKYKMRVDFVDDFKEAVSQNICFSRKSTTLLEAVYNGSQAAAILTNAKDKAVFLSFPSLQDERIKVFYEIQHLFEWIKKVYEKEYKKGDGESKHEIISHVSSTISSNKRK